MRSGAVVLIAQGVSVALGVVSISVLGRLLTPEDFGLVAIAAAFVALLLNFADHGFPQSTVQRKDVTDAQVNAIFWVNVGVSVGAALIGVGLAWPIALFYDSPNLVGVMIVLSLAVILTGFAAPQQALLRRHLRFRAISIITVASAATGITAAIAAALLGAGYWALVTMPITTTVVSLIAFWSTSSWRPKRPRAVDGLGEMVSFGVHLTGTSLVGTFARMSDKLIIGRGLGAEMVGIYANASRLILVPTTQLNKPLTSVAIPVLSRLQHEPERFRAFYSRGVEAVVMFLAPICLVAFVSAEHIVLLFLGDQWVDSIPVFQALAPAALVASTNVVTSWVYVPLGRTARQFRWQVFRSVCTVIAYFLGLQWGVVGVAVAYSILSIVIRVPAIIYCMHGTFLRLRDVVSALWRIGIGVVISLLFAVPTAMAFSGNSRHFLSLIVISLVVYAGYVIGFLLIPGGWTRLRGFASLSQHFAAEST